MTESVLTDNGSSLVQAVDPEGEGEGEAAGEVRLAEQIDEGRRGAVLGGCGREGEETTAALVQGHAAFNLTFNHDAHLTCQWKRQLLF